MKTQRVIIPEVVYSPSQDRYNKINERKQYSHTSAKTAAMLSAAMLALAANAKADMNIKDVSKFDYPVVGNTVEANNEKDNDTEFNKFILGMLGIIALLSVTEFAAVKWSIHQHDKDLYKFGWTPEEVHKMADELWADGVRFTPAGIKITKTRQPKRK